MGRHRSSRYHRSRYKYYVPRRHRFPWKWLIIAGIIIGAGIAAYLYYPRTVSIRDIVLHPHDYIGKTVTVEGYFTPVGSDLLICGIGRLTNAPSLGILTDDTATYRVYVLPFPGVNTAHMYYYGRIRMKAKVEIITVQCCAEKCEEKSIIVLKPIEPPEPVG